MFPWWMDLIYVVGGLAFYATDPSSVFRGILGIALAVGGLGDLAFNILLRLRASRQSRKSKQ
jgi:hypothetical protein